MRGRVPFLVIVFTTTAAPLGAAPPPKDTTAVPDETVAAEPAGTSDVEKARLRAKSLTNLKMIALALHNYESVHGSFPRNVHDDKGKAILSWRVQLLPFLENNKLSEQFRTDEPWDGKNNKALLDKMPDVFASPRVTVKAKGYTVYQGFTGDGAFFGSNRPLGIQHIADGTSNTLFAVEATSAVPWTKPADVPFDPKKDLPDFGKAFDGKPLGAMLDGSVRVLDTKTISMGTMKAAVTIAGGEVMGPDW